MSQLDFIKGIVAQILSGMAQLQSITPTVAQFVADTIARARSIFEADNDTELQANLDAAEAELRQRAEAAGFRPPIGRHPGDIDEVNAS